MRILLLSDSHGALPKKIEPFLKEADEIWHAGDIGPSGCLDFLESMAPVRAVYGNIDGREIRLRCPEYLNFNVQGLSFFMMHILGRPGRYSAQAKSLIQKQSPKFVICGHSHIALVAPGQFPGTLHLNPGAVGNHGWHKSITALRFQIENQALSNLDLIDLGPRGTEQPMVYF